MEDLRDAEKGRNILGAMHRMHYLYGGRTLCLGTARVFALEIGLVGWIGKRPRIQRNRTIRKHLQSFCGHKKEEAGACAEVGHILKAA